MLVERHALSSTPSLLLPAGLPSATRSIRSSDGAPWPLTSGNQSLATSLEAVALQKSIVGYTRDDPASAFHRGSYFYSGMFPMLIDVAVLELALQQDVPAQDVEEEQIADKLHAVFKADPLENGFDHPAETIIQAALEATRNQHVLGWLRTLSLDIADPGFASSVLRCLGRLDLPGSSSWRISLVRDALVLDDVEIRDAAAQAADSWADRNLIDVLAAHEEPEGWLRDYIRDIMSDLQENN